MQNKKHWANTEPCGTSDVMFDRGTGVFDRDILFSITQIRLKPALHNTSGVIMLELTHQYIMINCVECL